MRRRDPDDVAVGDLEQRGVATEGGALARGELDVGAAAPGAAGGRRDRYDGCERGPGVHRRESTRRPRWQGVWIVTRWRAPDRFADRRQVLQRCAPPLVGPAAISNGCGMVG